MADEPNGRPTWRDLNDIKRDLAHERASLEARLRGEITDAKDTAKSALKIAGKTNGRLNAAAATLAGGIGLATGGLILWAQVIHPIWLLLKAGP